MSDKNVIEKEGVKMLLAGDTQKVFRSVMIKEVGKAEQ